MPSNSIYKVFKWMGIVMKYTGTIPLPSLYEKGKADSKVNQLLFGILLPLLLWVNCAYGLFDCCYMGMIRKMDHNLTDLLGAVILIIYALYTLLFPFQFYFQVSSKLATYLKFHSKIDPLIKPHQNHLKLIANILLILALTLNFMNSSIYSYLRCFEKYNNEYPVYETFAAMNYLYFSTCFYYQPAIMYIAFQYVLKCAFKELLKRIQEEKGAQNGNFEDAKKKLRLFSTLNNSLCQLCKLLDDMTSPLIAHQFLNRYFVTLDCLTFITIDLNLTTLSSSLEYLLSFIVIVFIPMAAQETKNVASQIVSAAYSSFDLNNKEIAKEMHIFALQTFQFKVNFSAASLFQLDRSLVLNVIQSILGQWVVFFKIHHE